MVKWFHFDFSWNPHDDSIFPLFPSWILLNPILKSNTGKKSSPIALNW